MLYRDRWLTLRSDSVRLPNGNTLTPYHVIEIGDWVNVVAISASGAPAARRAVPSCRGPDNARDSGRPCRCEGGSSRPPRAANCWRRQATAAVPGMRSARSHPAASRFTQPGPCLPRGRCDPACPRRWRRRAKTFICTRSRGEEFAGKLRSGSVRLQEANQMSTLLLVHLFASRSSDPAIRRLILRPRPTIRPTRPF